MPDTPSEAMLRHIAAQVKEAAYHLNAAMGEAHEAGLRVGLETREFRVLGREYGRQQVHVTVEKPL